MCPIAATTCRSPLNPSAALHCIRARRPRVGKKSRVRCPLQNCGQYRTRLFLPTLGRNGLAHIPIPCSQSNAACRSTFSAHRFHAQPRIRLRVAQLCMHYKERLLRIRGAPQEARHRPIKRHDFECDVADTPLIQADLTALRPMNDIDQCSSCITDFRPTFVVSDLPAYMNVRWNPSTIAQLI